jgi:GDP-4-dehydro-6-deoxy-D-mannose reductase
VIVLVTGAAGASGAALLALLEADGHSKVLTTDLRELSRAGHVTCDLTNAVAVLELVKQTRPDRIFHLAGTFTNRFETDHRCNVLATQALLDAVHTEVPKCRVLLVGSAAEYGLVATEENPISESRAAKPASVYGLTKAMQTMLMDYFHLAFGMDLVLARTFNLKGPGLAPNLLPGRLDREIERLKRGEIEAIELGRLDGRRDFVSVEEAAALYVRIAKHGTSGEVYNVASGIPVSLRDYVEARLAEDGLGKAAYREGAPTGKSANVLDIWADVRKVSALP